MPITFACECGRTLRADEKYAGRRTRCPGCQTVQVIPAAVPEAEPAGDVLPLAVSRPRTQKGITAEKPVRKRPEPEEDVPEALPAEEKPRKRRARIRHDDEDLGRRRRRDSGSVLDKGVIGGLAMMGIAVVWFVGGLFGGIIFYYPPVLFVLGLIAFIKGLIDGR